MRERAYLMLSNDQTSGAESSSSVETSSHGPDEHVNFGGLIQVANERENEGDEETGVSRRRVDDGEERKETRESAMSSSGKTKGRKREEGSRVSKNSQELPRTPSIHVRWLQ